MGALEAQPLPGTEGAEQPFWSPDSRHVGFAASGKLKKIDISGGPPQNLCDVVGGFQGGTWNREGVLIFSGGAKLFRVSDAGGPRSDLGSSEQTGLRYFPRFLPDGRHFIYSTFPQGLHVASLDGGPSVQVLDVSSIAAYASPGFLLYHREDVLFAHAFDTKHFQLAGEPVRVADGVALSANGIRAAFSVSDTGVLVFRTGRALERVVELAWMSRTGKAMGTVGEPGNYRQIRLSPDEKRVAMWGADWRLFTLDLGSGITGGLTFNDDGLSSLTDPVWRPDGRALAFRATRNGKLAFYQQILGTRDATVLFELANSRGALSDWSPDGRFLLFQTLPPSELYAAPLSGDPKPVLLAKSQKTIDSPHFSPDGKWVSYNTDESGTWETWVASFPAFDNRQQVSSRGGGQARWRADGKELFYLTPDGQVMSVAIESDPKTGALEFKAPTVLFQSPIATPNMFVDQYDVTRDGQRFIFLKPRIDPNAAAEPLAPITVMVNWQAGLTK
jgi:Tol biopolymer transport system component